jgi:hypothetical protein
VNTQEQLQEWVRGNNVHDDKRECVPDFSCCRPHLAVPLEERRRFMLASREQRGAMLCGYLMALLNDAGHEVVTSCDVLSGTGRGA